MQIAIVAAGFTAGEADALRRAMGAWKRTGGLDPFRERLLQGMHDKGYPLEFAQRIYQQMLGFGEYGFPQCVVGETRVVDADSGRWVSIDEVISGRAPLDATVACDAHLRLRRRRVIAVKSSGVKPVWRLRTALGHAIAATTEHPFLTLTGWRALGELRVGDCVAAARAECLAAVLRPELARLTAPEVDWDRVVAIEALAPQPTYDLQIEGDHNFLANNLVVHNSHAMSFALLVYDSAWLKCYEPAAFTCALLNSQPMGFYAPAQLVRDARAHGVEVRPVDACVSLWDSTLEPRADGEPALRLGLRLVKSLTEAGARRLIAARHARPFTSVQDLSVRGGARERRPRGAGRRRCLCRPERQPAPGLLGGGRHRAPAAPGADYRARRRCRGGAAAAALHRPKGRASSPTMPPSGSPSGAIRSRCCAGACAPRRFSPPATCRRPPTAPECAPPASCSCASARRPPVASPSSRSRMRAAR